jgi:acetyl-CoA carboxylase carboxyltransferase component
VPYDRQHAVTISDHVHRLRQVREQAIQGDDLATTRQHRKGKLTARERLEHLLDEGSFAELDIFRRPMRPMTRVRGSLSATGS